jgi:hypothetical protein
LLMFPAVLFMGALVVRMLQPLQHEPAHTAQRIVMWYALRATCRHTGFLCRC